MSRRTSREFQHRELLENVLLRAGYDLVVVEPQKIEYGDLETLQRFALTGDSVIEWRGSRGTGAETGTRFESAADAETWIITKACGFLRDARGLRRAHWLHDREQELPQGFTLCADGDGVVLSWVLSGTEHKARFGGALPRMSAVQFSTVAQVPIDRIEACAVQPDSRAAFAAEASER